MFNKIIKIIIMTSVFIGIVTASGYLTLSLIVKSEETVIVPDVVGKDVVFALEILSDLGLNTKVKSSEYSNQIPKNHVIFQDPHPGETIKKDRDVKIILSKGADTLLMPNLAGLSLRQSYIVLEENGLCQGKISYSYHASKNKDEIIAHFPAAGNRISKETCTNMLVSLGRRPTSIKMPDFTNLSFEDAILSIERSQLNLGEIKQSFKLSMPENSVLSQEPLPGKKMIQGDIVNLTINKDPTKRYEDRISYTSDILLLKYPVEKGLLNRHVRLRLNQSGISSDLFDEHAKPGSELWFLIPTTENTTFFLYVDDELIKPEIQP